VSSLTIHRLPDNTQTWYHYIHTIIFHASMVVVEPL
jgi:hypothetical protein